MRYHSTKSVKSLGFNKYDKIGFDEDSDIVDGGRGGLPLVNQDFHSQYKRNMDLTNMFYKPITPKPSIQDFHKQNELGLQEAYTSPTHLYKHNDTLYMVGTKNGWDLYDDVKIPFGLTRYTQRYIDADQFFKNRPFD
jgi:hypothetical protein